MATTDPFAASGGGVQVNGQWVPKSHPLAAGATGASTTSGGQTQEEKTLLNFTPTAAPAFTAPTWQAPGMAAPTLGAAAQWQGPAAFAAPTAQQMQQDPGYQFRLQEGQRALDMSAAARGTLRGGAQLKALQGYGQQLGSQEYQNAYNRAKDTYGLAYDAARDTYNRQTQRTGDEYAADVNRYGWDAQERANAYNAAFRGSEAEYAPAMSTWQAQNLSGQRNAEFNAQNQWQRETYYNDDDYRRWRDEQDNSYRWGTWRGDDAWRRERAPIQDRQFLASLGNIPIQY